MAVQPLSHKVPMDRSGWRSAGKMCALRAAAGKVGRFKVAVWVDSIVVPSGKLTVMPLGVACFSVTGVLEEIKWPVQPVSAM